LSRNIFSVFFGLAEKLP